MLDPIRLLRDLVAIGSVNPMGRELSGPWVGEGRLTEFLLRLLRDTGIPCDLQAVEPGRSNVLARVDVPGARNTVLFEVHQDTVPVDGMSIPPFSAEVRDGKVWGRGSCDVKGGMAAMITAVERLFRERPRGASSVLLAFAVDEECGFAGVRRLVRDLGEVSMAVVAEPTRLEVVRAHKGVARWIVRTEGRSCHSSAPERGVNAIYRMAPVIEAIEEYGREVLARPVHPLLGSASISVGLVRGGLSVNTVPAECLIEVDRRLLPGEDGASAMASCRRYVTERPGVTGPVAFEAPYLLDPALETAEAAEVVQRAARAVRRMTGSCGIGGVPYGTDGSKIAEAGVPTVVLGPGDIAQAHTAAEWIDMEEVRKAAEIYYGFLTDGT